MGVHKFKGRWRIDVKAVLGNGERVRVRRYSPVDTKRGAEQYERQVREALLTGEWFEEEPPEEEPPLTVAQFEQEFMEVYVKTNNKYSDYVSKMSIFEHHIIPFFGDQPLEDVRVRDIEAFKAAQQAKGLAPKTINNHLTVLSALLRVAESWEVIDQRPPIKRLKQIDPDWHYLGFAEATQLIQAAAKEKPLWHAMIVLALRTGMRQCELLALRWSAVDLKAATVVVRERVWRGDLDTPKSRTSCRTIPLSADACEALKAWRHLRGELVFCDAKGQRLTAGACKWPLWRTCEEAGLERIGWHVLRHTFASHLAMRGVPITTISELMGHSDLKTTQRYMHLSPAHKAEAVQLLDQPAPRLGQYGGNVAYAPAPKDPNQL